MPKSISDNHIEKTKSTYKEIYKDYASKNTVLINEIQKALDLFISYLPGKEVLDVGCASGRESKYLSDKGLDVSGCDFSEEFIALAKQRCPTCTFFVADMRDIKTSKKYDGLWVSASFLHIPKKHAVKTLEGFTVTVLQKIQADSGKVFLHFFCRKYTMGS